MGSPLNLSVNDCKCKVASVCYKSLVTSAACELGAAHENLSVKESRRSFQHERGTVAEEENLVCSSWPGSGNEGEFWELHITAIKAEQCPAGKWVVYGTYRHFFFLRLCYFSNLLLKHLANIPKFFWHPAEFSVLHLQGQFGTKFVLGFVITAAWCYLEFEEVIQGFNAKPSQLLSQYPLFCLGASPECPQTSTF